MEAVVGFQPQIQTQQIQSQKQQQKEREEGRDSTKLQESEEVELVTCISGIRQQSHPAYQCIIEDNQDDAKLSWLSIWTYLNRGRTLAIHR